MKGNLKINKKGFKNNFSVEITPRRKLTIETVLEGILVTKSLGQLSTHEVQLLYGQTLFVYFNGVQLIKCTKETYVI